MENKVKIHTKCYLNYDEKKVILTLILKKETLFLIF